MKCFYQIWGEEWLEGEVFSGRGGRVVCFEVRNEQGIVQKKTTLLNPEILFFGVGINVAGYERAGEGKYQLVSVDVRLSNPNSPQ